MIRKYKKILIIGGGAISINHHLPRILNFLGGQSICIYEVEVARREKLELLFKQNKKILILNDLPAEGVFDLVLIATPPKFHYDYYCALENRADIFLIEKPMALNADQAHAIMESSNKNNKKVFIHHIRRSLGSYNLIQQFYTKKYFGELKRVVVNEGGVFNWQAVSLGSFSKDLNGGGVLMDTGPHTLDLLFQVFDEMSLKSAFMDGVGNAIEANCMLDFVADASIPVTVSLSRNRFLSNTAVFEFSNAICTVGVRDNEISIETSNGISYAAYPSILNGAEKITFSQLIDAFYHNFIIPCDNTGVGPTESLKIHRLIDSAYRNAQLIEGGF